MIVATQRVGALVRSRPESSRADPNKESFEYAKILSVIEVPHPSQCHCSANAIVLCELQWYQEVGTTEGLKLVRKIRRSAGANRFFFADSIHPTPIVFVDASHGQEIVFELS